MIDAYDGIYEMSLIMSDPTQENPSLWSFGKINIKFSKPLDPLNAIESLKNIQKPKLEYVFPPEEKDKSSIFTMIFCSLIVIISLVYMVSINANNNLRNLGKKFPDSLVSLSFIAVIFGFALLLVAFWIKLNIIQTLIIIGVLSVPASFVLYKAIVKVEIDL